MSLTLTDIFAGAGGSSTGAASIPGVDVAIAANHWQLAVDVHQDNHQSTNHACVDLHMEDPRNFPRTDILWASPECTKWSIANQKAKALSVEMGGDPTLFDDVPVELESGEEDEITRSRLLMFDVLRFIEHHHYRAVIVENVVDIATQTKYSAAWTAWRKGLARLGYDFRVVSLNSMHAQLGGLPAPQSRDRLYIVAWPTGERAPDIDRALSPAAWCGRCDREVRAQQAWKQGREVGRYRAQYVYACPICGHQVEPGWLPAAAAIDWSLPAERIGDRRRPLSEKTMARIREGLRRYGVADPHLTQFRERTRTIDPRRDVLPTVVADGANHGLVTPRGVVLDSIRSAPIISSTDEPLRTQTTAYTRGLLIPVEGRNGKQAMSTGDPLRTQTCRNETGLLVPYYSASETAKPTSQPVGTLTCVDRYALVTLRNHGEARQLTGSMTTVTASGNHHGLLDVSEEDVLACRFRMLEPHEIALGMSFPGDYRWQGTKRERVRLAGNAVTPPAARDLVMVVAESITGELIEVAE
ncbi:MULTISPECIES: DNA cytosine methyltransferase [unclassified Luteococcus]|uniref:DNA cytosine methyltransferase n=1 Tax=unclassified Luteococcus TaxID=2639923 RepID=UPI00313C8A4E